jgi:pimeloyl-ACP methyl ester carboxylesterase
MDYESGAPPFLPEGRHVLLPGRGTTYVREVLGPPGAPVLVLLHGWTASSALNWFGCYRHLGRRFRVVAIDHRGHGRGIRSRRPFRLEDCADDVAALAEQLDIPHFIPVGYSMGGPIALLTWQRHPELVDGLVLCATARRFATGRPAERAIAGGMVGLSFAASLSPEGLRRMAVERFINGRLAGTALDRWAASELRLNDPVPLLQAGAALARFDARPWIGNVEVPSAVVVTESDQIVPTASQLALANGLPGSQVFRISGDHGVCATEPERFTAVLSAACEHVARQAPA